MADKVHSGTVEVEYTIMEAGIDGQPAYWWEAANGNFEEDEYYISLKDAISAVESYFGN